MKKPQRSQKWKKMMMSVTNRKCGDCTACCTVMGVAELGKPYAFPCQHLGDGGCTIYESRPDSCVGCECLWRQGAICGVAMRPDKCGVMFAVSRTADGIELGVYVLRDRALADGVVDVILTRFAPLCNYVTIYPLGSIVGVSYPLSDEYPNCGEVGYAAPALQVADGIKVYNGMFRPRHLLMPATGRPKTDDDGQAKRCIGEVDRIWAENEA